MTTSTQITESSLVALGGKVWEKDDVRRVYIDSSIFNKLCSTSFGDSSNKFFFDCKTNQLMRSYKGKKPQNETHLINAE